MLFKKMNQDRVQTILNKFDPEDAQAVIKYMRVPDLAQRIGTANALRCLQEIKTNLPKATDIAPNRVVMKLRHFASKYSSKESVWGLNALCLTQLRANIMTKCHLKLQALLPHILLMVYNDIKS